MKHYNLKTLQRTKSAYTDLFILTNADGDFVKNATTGVVLTGLVPGDVVDKLLSEVKTAVAGPTATLSLGITGTATQFSAATDIATATAAPYIAGKDITVGTGFIAATSGGAVTTALTNATSGVVGLTGVQSRYVLQSSTTNIIATTILSNVTVTAGEVWIWASIDRAADRVIQVN